jgi:uncharacterized protein YjeT (DUF2065 family)
LSLALLLLNDHVLKHAGVLPSWLTGTLSDIAGMVVAPIMVAVLLGARTRITVAGAFAVVALPFVAIKTSAMASAWYVTALASIGITAHNVVDPTDLVGLCSLLFAWHLATTDTFAWPRVALRRAGLTLAALGCVATSRVEPVQPEVPQTSTAWIANGSNNFVELRLRWIGSALECSAGFNELAQGVTRETFSAQPLSVRLQPQSTFPLGRVDALQAIMGFGTTTTPSMARSGACDAVLVQADNLPSTVVIWDTRTSVSYTSRLAARGNEPAKGVVLQDNGGIPVLRTTSGSINLRALNATPDACTSTAQRFEVIADQAVWTAGFTVVELTRLPDGCTRLAGEIASVAARVVVCAPEASIPVRVGDALRFERRPRSVAITTPRNETVTIYRAALATDFTSLLSLVPTRTCRGLDACDAFVEHYQARVNGVGAALMPGASFMHNDMRVVFGGASRTLIASERCGGETVSADVTYDLVMTRGVSP